MKKSILFFASIFLFLSIGNAQDDIWKFYKSATLINDLVETDEHLWLATFNGITSIDKTSFEKNHYNTQNSNIPSDIIQTLALDTEGQIWIGTRDLVLARFDEGNFVDLLAPSIPDSLIIPTEDYFLLLNEMLIDQNNVKWLATKHGLMKIEGTESTLYNYLNTVTNPDAPFFLNTFKAVWDLDLDDMGNLYFASFGLFKYDGEEFTELTIGVEELFVQTSYPETNLCIAGDKIWFHNAYEHVAYYENETWTILEEEDWNTDISPSSFHSFVMDQEGELYLSANGHIYKWNTNEHQMSVFVNELTNTDYSSNDQTLYFDQENNSWLSDRIYISKLENDIVNKIRFSKYPTPSNHHSKFTEAPDGTLHITNGGQISNFITEDDWSTIYTSLDSLRITKLAYNSQGEPWILYNYSSTSSQRGFAHWHNGAWEFFTNANANLNFIYLSDFVIDQNDQVWTCSQGGLSKYDGNTWTQYTSTNSPLEHNWLIHLSVDHDNNVWAIGNHAETDPISGNNYNNIYRISDEEWTVFNHSNTPILDDDHSFWDMYVDHDNNIWAWGLSPLINQPLYKYDGNEWSVFESINPNSEMQIWNMTSDSQGRLYFASRDGLHISDDGNWTSYTTDNSEISGNHIYNVHVRQDGSIWMSASLLGINVLYPSTTTSVSVIQQSTENITCFPNPASEKTTIEFELTTPSSVQLNLFNLQGELLKQEILSNLSTGKHQFLLDLKGLPKATYYLDLSGENWNGHSVILKMND